MSSDDLQQAVAVFRHARDNRVKMTAYPTWGELVRFLAEHHLTDGERDTAADKDRWMFTTALYVDDTGHYEPAPRNIYLTDDAGHMVLDEHSQPIMIGQEFPSDPETGKPFIKRCGANVLAYTALLLDYDGGQTIEWARERFRRHAVAGYTSYSHLKDGKTHKFRVCIPFHEPIPTAEFEARKDAFLDFAGSADPSTVAVSRGFYLPQVHPARAHLAVTWSHDGESLDWTTLAKRKPWVPLPPPVTPISGDALTAWGRERLERQLDRIRNAGEGSRHDAVLRACRAIGSDVAAGAVDHHAAAQVILVEALAAMGAGRRGEIESMIRSGFRLGAMTPSTPPDARPKSAGIGTHVGAATPTLASYAKRWW